MSGLVRRIRFADKPGIVYVATRNNAETIMAALQEEGISASFYHAGLRAAERSEIHEKFMSGGVDVIVATNAFGMGVDKADVRFVYHFDITDSLDSYYQEIGRAGRDGKPAEAVLFYRAENMAIRKFQAGSGNLDRRMFARLIDVLRNEGDPMAVEEIVAKMDLSKRKVTSALNRLQEVGAVEMTSDGEMKLSGRREHADAAELAAAAQKRMKIAKRERIAQMQQYAEISTCRREYLLRYFGDAFTGPCNNCDNDGRIDGAEGSRREV
jgi:ATP-dependent DNA helicase RecQ